jgi:predicted MFS family arabinose efflux permease
MLANVSFYIFFDNYLTARFGIGLFGTSMAMMVLGIAVAISSSLLVEPAQQRVNKSMIVAATSVVMAVSALIFTLADTPLVCYLTIGTFYFGFGITYPTLLGIFRRASARTSRAG